MIQPYGIRTSQHASLILTSNLPFSGWGGVFGDQAVAAAMIDRVVHHADVLTLKGASYQLRNRGIDTLPASRPKTRQTKNRRTGGLVFERRIGPTFERCRQLGGCNASPPICSAHPAELQ